MPFHFVLVECISSINGTLSYINYFRVLQNLLCAFFTAFVSHYGKFTVLHKLILIVLQSSKNFPRNHAVPGLFFKNCSWNEGVVKGRQCSYYLTTRATQLTVGLLLEVPKYFEVKHFRVLPRMRNCIIITIIISLRKKAVLFILLLLKNSWKIQFGECISDQKCSAKLIRKILKNLKK